MDPEMVESINFRISDHIPEEDVKAFIHRAMQRK